MGRGSSGGGGGGGGLNPANIKNPTSLISAREGKTAEVDSVLNVAQDVYGEYGTVLGDFILADVVGKDSNTLAYTDGTNVGFNTKFFDVAGMTTAMDGCVSSGFHPPRGNKTAIESVAAHEFGHVLAGRVANGDVMAGSNMIINRARGRRSWRSMAEAISGYAKTNKAETVAEAFADVYCNGQRAKAESHSIVNALNSFLKP